MGLAFRSCSVAIFAFLLVLQGGPTNVGVAETIREHSLSRIEIVETPVDTSRFSSKVPYLFHLSASPTAFLGRARRH